MRFAVVFFISCLTGLALTRCASVPVAEKIIRQEGTNAEASEMVDRSNLTQTEKTFVRKALTDSLTMARDENKAATIAQAKADSLAKYRNILVSIGLALSGFLIWRFWR